MTKYNIDTKVKAIELYNKGLGSTTITKKLVFGEEVTILKWVRLWNKHGLSGFIDCRKVIKMSKKNTNKNPEQENEELKKRLEAENAYLKN